jgi:hypothetical protein
MDLSDCLFQSNERRFLPYIIVTFVNLIHSIIL